MANKDLIKEYDEWKKKRDSREYNYDSGAGVSSDDLVGEYNSWKKNYEASQQRVKPTARLSQPSPLMQGALDMANPLSKNYVDPFAQKASYDWYSQPESKRSDILSRYAQQAAFDTKYDGMSYADRAAALEELKRQLKGMSNPEQGAEYQYLRNNLAADYYSPSASLSRSQDYSKKVSGARRDRETLKRENDEYLASTSEYNSYLNELGKDYSSSPFFDYKRMLDDAEERGLTEKADEIRGYLDRYRRSVAGTREGELIDAIMNYSAPEATVNEIDVLADENRAEAYRRGALSKFDEHNLSLYSDGDKRSIYTLALEGAGIASTGNEAEDRKRFEETLGEGKNFPMYISEQDRRNVEETLFKEYAHSADNANANYKQVTSEEKALYYALIAKGKNSEAAAYINSLRNDLYQRAKSADAKRRSDKIKEEGAFWGTIDAIGQTALSVPGSVLGGIPSALDFAGQIVSTGEYDPYLNPEMHVMQNEATASRQAVSDTLRDVTGGGLAPFLYNAGMSAVDSAVGAIIGNSLGGMVSTITDSPVAKSLAENAYTFIMGSGAASSRAEELYLRGASNEQIIYGAITAGLIESLFEEFSLQNLMHPNKTWSVIRRILTQAGVEGSEELATDIANHIAGIGLDNNSDINTSIRELLANNPDMSYQDAQKEALKSAAGDTIESFLAGALSGGLSAGAYDASTGVQRNFINRSVGKNISSNYQAENTVKQGLEADENSEAYKLAKDIDERQRDGKKVSNKALGELARTLDTEMSQKNDNALEKAFEYRREAAAAETVENALKENGATEEEAADLAPLVSKSILGEELTDAEQTKIDNNTAAVRYMDEVGSKTSEISGETGLQQLALRVNATTRGTGSTKASDRLRESALDKVFETAMRNELKPAKLSDNEIGKANETSYKVSTAGKTTYNGKAVNIDAISEIGDGNALVTLDNGETAKLSEIEFADKGEAVAWQAITSIDGITPKAASELIAQYENKPANVTAGVWARGIAEGYEIGRSGKLGTKEFPKAEASAKYLSNIGNDARRISETVGRQDARYEQHKEAIEVDRKNVNNKNVNDAADTLDKMGRKYKIVEGIDGDGYIEKDGTIVLNKDAKDPIGFVLKHELTHYAETSKDYDDFVKAVKGSKAFAAWIDKQSLKDGTQLQQEGDYLRRLKDRYRRHGVTLTNTEAHREMIANFVGDTLFNENGVGLDGLVNGMNAADRNAVMRFLTKIADFFRKHFTKKGERAYLEHFFSQLQNTATGERTSEKTYTFAGENAATSNVQTLSEAKELIEQGADPEEVRQQTGWFKGMDGKWRFEIDDSNIAFDTTGRFSRNPDVRRYLELLDKIYYQTKGFTADEMSELKALDQSLKGAQTKPRYLGDFLRHGELFKAYPELMDIGLDFAPLDDAYGQYSSKENTITISDKLLSDGEQLKATLIHEIQHAVQRIEGFASGANIMQWADKIVDQDEGIKKAEAAKAEIKKKLEAFPYSGGLLTSPDRMASKYVLLKEYHEDRHEEIDEIEQLAKKDGYYELLKEYYKAHQNINTAIEAAYNASFEKAIEKYYATAGEIEARDVSARKNLTNEERKAKRPDIDRKEVAFAEGNEKTYSIAETENDEKYLDAVNSGDMETAQRMVDEAAKKAGYTTKAYHGTDADFWTFRHSSGGDVKHGNVYGEGVYFAKDKRIAEGYGGRVIGAFLRLDNPLSYEKKTISHDQFSQYLDALIEAQESDEYLKSYPWKGNTINKRAELRDFDESDTDEEALTLFLNGFSGGNDAVEQMAAAVLYDTLGRSGYLLKHQAAEMYIMLDRRQIKSADPVTYDDNGNVIPLSERFNESNEDIRWSIPETAERERAQSIKQIERLNETVTHLRDMLKLQRTQTHGTVMTQASVARQADRLMDRWDVYVGKGELTKLLNTFYTTVAQKINQREATWEEVAEAAEPVVDFLLSKQVTETEDESVRNVVNYLKGKAIRLNDIQRAEIKHVYGSVTAWQKAIAGTVKLRNDGIALDSLWQEASELHPDWFDPDVTSDADMPIRLAETAKQLQDSLWMEQELPDEAWQETKRDILYDVYETFFDAAPIQTLADKQAKEMSELRAKAYAKIEQVKDAASTRIQNLKEADRERYERLRRDKNAKIEEVKAEARERRQRERERRKKSQLRAEIKDRISEFNDKLLRPGKNKYVPMEFVRSVAGFLKDIDIGAKPGTKVSEKLAALKVKYDALKNDKYYSAAYNEQIGNLLQTVATEIGDTPLPKMSAYQLELLNNMLRALNHRIERAVSVDRISKSKNAFEYARELINELNAVDRRAITGTTAGKLLDMQVRPQTMFERFAGFKKNSYWSQLYDALDAAQLRETQLSMEAQQMFTDLLNDRKNYKKLADSVDIGLTDEEGNPVLISRGMMLSIRRALMNADNTRHIVGGGFTVPDFDLYYKGKTGDAFNKKGKRVFGFAADMADIAHQIGELRETMAEQEAAGESTAETETKIADLESQFNELKDRSNAYAAQLAATIDDHLTMYEQNLLSMADVFFDEWSKDILNEATLAVYGFKKANVEKYFPIKVDNNYTETKFDTFSNDISLENAGFMKDRVMSSKPILLQDITDVISDQIKKVSRYAAYLEVLDDFKRIYNVTLPGSSDSVQDALGKRFAGEEGKKFIENLLQDIQGGRRGGSVTLFDKARGKLAAATLTLNARVALAQAASFPTAAAELGWAPIMKALGKTFKKTDKELIMKYSPLLAYRSWGFSSTEIGDARRIKDIRHKVDSKLRWLTGWITSVDSYTVGHLWYAAEYYVDANNKDLEKGSEKYYEEVAKVFNRTIEKTQPNYTTLQRPELMRTNNELVKQLSMFMTQRLQNVNILYEAFARYDKYKKDFKAGKNGVTREDVIEARKARTRAIESQIIAAATISIIKNLTDMLLHSFKKRDDDDDYDLTDAGWNLLDAFCDSIISNVVLGSEAYSFLKSKITGDRYYGISLGGVGAITETVDDVSDFIDATKKAFAGSDMNWKTVKNLGYSMSRLMGIPVQNAVKYVTAVSEWAQDAKADQFNHGNYVGKVGVRLYLAEGRTSEAIKEINEQQAKGVDMQSTVRDFYKPLYLDAKKRGDTTEMAEIGRELSKIIDETGVYKKSADKVLAGWVSQDEKAAKEK